MAENRYDVMILGTGPGGITAALYGQPLGLNTVVFGDIPGGSVYMIENIMNYPGFIGGVPGTQFGTMAFQQAQSEGASFTMSRLEKLNSSDDGFKGIDANGQEYTAPSAIVATGRVPMKLAVSNAHVKGVHFCSICDGPLYRGKDATLAVVGSDNAAAQHALSLSRIADKVMLICRSDSMQMDAAHFNQVEKQPNIYVHLNTEVTGYKGLDLIEGMVVKSKEGTEKEIAIDGLFLAIGWQPNTNMLDIQVETTLEGYLKTNEKLMTSFPGLFAAGDVRDTDMWQVLTACADGARAARYAAEFVEKTNT
ncbi:MAG: FAD-dependent oxidoreductase [Deltaproteobacteria bacterium]|jgi:thioredoxin reductase (NADPH)|nr:FAD-dependent oxidoreductase [Deltaproteobacteria bacterium]